MKRILLSFLVFSMFLACKKNKTETIPFKFTKISGNSTVSAKGILSLEWVDNENTSWNILLRNLNTGVLTTRTTTNHNLTDSIVLSDNYRITVTGNKIPVDTTNPCNTGSVNARIGNMPDLFTTFNPCPPFSITNVFAEKVNATTATTTLGWSDANNTSWKVKITNLTTAVSNTSSVAVTDLTLNFALDQPQAIEITGDQNGAKKSVNVQVNNDATSIVSNFY